MKVQNTVIFGKHRYRLKRKQYPKAGPIGDFYKLVPSPPYEVVILVADGDWVRAHAVLSQCFVVAWGKTPFFALADLHAKLEGVATATAEILEHAAGSKS